MRYYPAFLRCEYIKALCIVFFFVFGKAFLDSSGLDTATLTSRLLYLRIALREREKKIEGIRKVNKNGQ